MAEEIEKVENVADSVMAAMKELDEAEDSINTEGKIEEEEPAEEEAEAQEEPETADEEEEAEPSEDEEQEEAVELKAPENWDKDRQDAFDGLENDASKQAYLDTFKSLERGFQVKRESVAETVKEHEAIVNLMQPFEAQLQSAGLDRVGGIRSLVGAQQLLQQNPIQGLTQLLQTYGGNNAKAIVETWAKQLGITQAAAEGEAYVDPDIATLKGQISELTNVVQQTQTNAQQQQNTEVQNQVDLFEKATDESGNVLHPHFPQVREIMGTLIQGGLAPTMDEAYTMAIRTDVNLHSELMKAEREQEASKNNKERKQVVAEGKKAKNISTNNVAPDKEPPEPDNVLDSVKKAHAAVG